MSAENVEILSMIQLDDFRHLIRRFSDAGKSLDQQVRNLMSCAAVADL